MTMYGNSGRRFLEEVDAYIRDNVWTLTGADLHAVYRDFFKDLKEFKGNANGFTGLSEYLVFRSLYHLLGGAFDRHRAPGSHEVYEFQSTLDKRIRIGQSVPVRIGDKRYYPDITLYESDNLTAVSQVKLYLTGGQHEVTTEVQKLEALRTRFPGMRALLIIFSRLSKKGTVMPVLEAAKASKPWCDYVVLEPSKELFSSVLVEGLSLHNLIRHRPTA